MLYLQECYRIQVFDIAYLEDDVIEQFTSDFKLVAKFFKQKRLGNVGSILRGDNAVIKHVQEFLNLLSVFTKDERYAEAYDDDLQQMVEKGEVRCAMHYSR